MTTTTTHRITIDSDGLGARWNCRDCRRTGGYDLTRQMSAYHAEDHLRLAHRQTARISQDDVDAAAAVIAERLFIPSEAGRVAKELAGHRLLVGGFPPGDKTPVELITSIVTWRSPKTPAGCYTAADYERAARDLAEALDAAGLLVKPHNA